MEEKEEQKYKEEQGLSSQNGHVQKTQPAFPKKLSSEKFTVEKIDDNFELRSEEVQEILSYIPRWIVRWGITVILAIVLMLLFMSWMIKYPDLIPGRFMLTTQNPPVKLVAKTSGQIEKLYASDKAVIKKGQYIAAIDNPTSIEDIIYLKKLVTEFKKYIAEPESYKPKFDEANYTVGEVQDVYNNILKQYHDFEIFLRQDYHQLKIEGLKIQITHYQQMKKIVQEQFKLSQDEMRNIEEKYLIDKELYKDNTISKFEFKTAENGYFQKKSMFENMNRSVVENDIALSESRKNLLDLQYQFNELKRNHLSSLRSSISTLDNYTTQWENNYILIAPVDGVVSYLKSFYEKQFVTTGQEMFAIIPASTEYVGYMYVPGQGLGKIRIGQKVKIKFDNYPYEEYGQVEGKVIEISALPENNLYRMNVALDNGLITSSKHKLAFKPEMQGNAEVITENLRLIERFFHTFRKLLK